MEHTRLERNLTDNIYEAQLKLGYDGRPMSLNYTHSSLRHLAGEDWSDELWEEFCEAVRPRLGELGIRPVSGGYCITVPAEGTAYVHGSAPADGGFIAELIEKVRSHGISAGDVTDLFRKYSDKVEVRELNGEEADYAVWFTDGVPDGYVYCLTEEPCMGGGCHVTYHRFIPEDFEELGLE